MNHFRTISSAGFPVLVLAFLCMKAGLLSAYEDRALWLPASYQHWLKSLHEMATSVEKREDCVRVLRGRLVESRSTLDHPVFHFICRSAVEGTTLAVTMDGLSGMEVSSARPASQASLGGQFQNLRDAEAERLAQRQRRYEERTWITCLERLRKKIVVLREAQILSEQQPPPLYPEENKLLYYIDVDAENLSADVLHYTAVCIAIDNTEPELTVSRRLPAEERFPLKQ